MRLLAVVSVLALSAAIVAPAQGAKHRASCARAKTHTVAKDGQARVFTRSNQGSAQWDKRLFGCLRSRDKVVRLSEAYDDGYVTSYGFNDVRLAGRFVAWSAFSSDQSCKADCPPGFEANKYGVAVRDLRRAKTRRAKTSTTPGVVLVSKRGVLVWTVGRTLRAFDSTGNHVLDDAVSDPETVRLAGNKLMWDSSGLPHESTLGHY
jgi:hypothetical protein